MAATRKCFDLKVSLIGVDPPIWRAFGIPADYALDDLHEILQIVMGWHGYHSHLFQIKDQLFSSDYDLEGVSRRKLSLSAAFKRSPSGFQYHYDFGDGWRHEITLLGTQRIPHDDPPPMCWGGEGACPPEDVGGVGGFAEFVSALADQNHENHAEYLEWIGGGYDPACFSARQATAGLIAWWRMKEMRDMVVTGLAERMLRDQPIT